MGQIAEQELLRTLFILSNRKTKMTQTKIQRSCRIARLADKQGARPAKSAWYAVEKSATEQTPPKEISTDRQKERLMKGKKEQLIATFNVRTLTGNSQLGELVASAVTQNHEVICIQEHRHYHEDIPVKYHQVGKNWTLITSTAWKNSTGATIGGIGILLSPNALKALNSVETITEHIMISTFNGNPLTTVICAYSPPNVSDEVDVDDFYNNLSTLTRHVPQHNFLILGGDMNAQLGKSDGYKYSYHDTSNRNGKKLHDFVKENDLFCLNTKYQHKMGRRWTHTYPNSSKAQLDYIFLNKKWKNSAMNCRAYNTFDSVKSDHRIVTAKFRLSLRANKIKVSQHLPADWSNLHTSDKVRQNFTLCMRNRFEALKSEDDTPNVTFENLITACKEAWHYYSVLMWPMSN